MTLHTVSEGTKSAANTSRVSGWWVFLFLVLAVVGAAYWYKNNPEMQWSAKLFNAVEAKSLLHNGNNDGEYIEY